MRSLFFSLPTARAPRFGLLSALALLGLTFQSPPHAQAQELSAAAYVIVDHQSGQLLEALNPHKKLQIASLTKIATATLVLDWAHAGNQNLDQIATVPPSAAPLVTPGSGAALAPGDKVSLRDLLYAALLQSDNVAAQTLSSHVGRHLAPQSDAPAEIAFIAQMNALARKLQMPNTRFLNAHGLDSLERKLPYSTASDLGKLAAYAMSNSQFRFLVSQKERRIQVTRADGTAQSLRLTNTNELLGQNDIDGVKTGTTKKAGQCVIVSSARSPEVKTEGEFYFPRPRRLEVVVLGSENRFPEAQTLLKRGWKLFDEWVAANRPSTPTPFSATPVRPAPAPLPPTRVAPSPSASAPAPAPTIPPLPSVVPAVPVPPSAAPGTTFFSEGTSN